MRGNGILSFPFPQYYGMVIHFQMFRKISISYFKLRKACNTAHFHIQFTIKNPTIHYKKSSISELTKSGHTIKIKVFKENCDYLRIKAGYILSRLSTVTLFI